MTHEHKPMRWMTKLGFLAVLYLAQGLPYGFFTQALPVLLRKQGLSLPAIGLTSLLALPWALKFLWAPLVDGRWWPSVGRRRSWILPTQALAIGVLLLMTGLDPGSEMVWLLTGIFVINALAATQDIATDGLAVSLLDDHERGLGNGVQVAGYRVGTIVGGGALLITFSALGWSLTFATMIFLMIAASLPVLAWKEPPTQRPDPPAAAGQSATQNSGPGPLRRFVGRDGIGPWLVLLLVYKTGDALGGGMVKPFMVDIGLELEQIGALIGTVGFIAGLVGAMLGGWWVGKLGRRKALLLFGALQSVAIGLYVLPALGWTQMRLLGAIVCGEHFMGGLATAALFTAMMDVCDPDQGGTDYTVQASIVVIANGGAAALSGFAAKALGFEWFFVVSAVLSALGLLALRKTIFERLGLERAAQSDTTTPAAS